MHSSCRHDCISEKKFQLSIKVIILLIVRTAKSKKQRRIAAKAERKALKANPNLAFAAPKVPFDQQSIDLPAATPSAQDVGESEAQKVAREARESLTGVMRKSRRKSIKESNFLKAMR